MIILYREPASVVGVGSFLLRRKFEKFGKFGLFGSEDYEHFDRQILIRQNVYQF